MSNEKNPGDNVFDVIGNIERCSKCTLPITWETIRYDDDQVCNICKNWMEKKDIINWVEREKLFLEITKEAKLKAKETNAMYDCIIPFSGGKDSTFTLYKIVKDYGLKPLVVSFDHGFYRPKTINNRIRTFRRLGVDVVTFTPNWLIVKKLMLESLIRKGDFCWHCHAGVISVPYQYAIKFKIPLIIWGEGGGEYEAYFKYSDLEENNEWKFNRRVILGMRAEDMAGFIDVELRDLAPFIYPTQKEMDEAGIKSIHLGKYIPWNVRKQSDLIKNELDWEFDEVESTYPGPTYEKVECMFTGVRDYVKFLKRNFSRITHLTTLDIRHGDMTREEAMKIILKDEIKKPKSLEVFLEYVGISEEEFNRICALHLISPAKFVDPSTIPDREKLWDQDLWFRDNNKKK